MATIQKTLVYLGNEPLPPDVKLEFEFPVFKYTELNITKSNNAEAAKTIIQREIVKRYLINHHVQSNFYSVNISECDTIWKGDLQIRQRYLRGQFNDIDILSKSNLEDISFIVHVKLFHKDALISTQELDVIDIVTVAKNSELDFFFINKYSYAKLVDSLNIGSFSNVLLLALFLINIKNSNDSEYEYTISKEEYIDLVSKYLDRVYSQITEEQRNELIRRKPTLLDRIREFDLNSLFDFPITIPPIEPVETLIVEGTFTIYSNNPEGITFNDLTFYNLSLNYFNGSFSRTLHFDWNSKSEINANEPIDFYFTIEDAIKGTFSIDVKGVDGSTLWQKNYKISDRNLPDIQIRVPLMRPNTLNLTSENFKNTVKKLRGKVIQTGRNQSLNELMVLIQAKMPGDTLWRIVGAAKTDGDGNFSLGYPYGNYSEAEALISLVPDSTTPVRIIEGRNNETISDDFLYLLLLEDQLTVEDPGLKEDCHCNSPIKARRLPDQADLIESDEYTQDVGGTCMNLTTPNRTLREYQHQAIVRVSDPTVANYTLERIRDSNENIFYRLRGNDTTITRGEINFRNPIRWQDAPGAGNSLSVYQAVTVATGHILHYKSVFKADGYSLGELLYSLPLAPGQKKQIVVFDSSHSLSGAESQTISQGESLSASLINDRTITDQLSGTIGESLDGRSNASTSGMSAGLGLGGSVGPIGGTLGVSGGFANSDSSASQNSSRDISQFFGERLRQSIMQNAESYRQLNATVITTVKEGQQYAVTTESVANHNHCHALTMMYFEVLRHYAIYQELAYVEECVFVPLLMTNFNQKIISKWKDVLAKFLLPLPSSTYLQPFNMILKGRQHPLLKAFDANERIETGYTQVNYPAIDKRYADEVMTSVQGTMTLRVNLKRPKTRYDRIKSLPMVTQTVSREEIDVESTIRRNALVTGLPFGFLAFGTDTRTVTEEIIVVGKMFDQFMELDANYATVPPAKSIRIKTFQPRSIVLPDGTATRTSDEFFEDGANDKRLWSAYAGLLGYPEETGVYDMLEYYFAGKLISEWDEIFYNDIIPQVFHEIVDNIYFERLSFDTTILSDYNRGERSINVRLRAFSTGVIRSELPETIIITTNDLVKALYGVGIKLIVENINLNYTTDHFEGTFYKGYVGDDLFDNVALFIPLTTADKRNPRKEDTFLVRQLIEHLNSNLEYYNKILWYNLDPDRRFMLLDGFHIQIYNEFGVDAGFKSLASVVKNQLITITGNSMVFPVAAGYKVSQSFIMARTTEDEGATQAQITLLDHYKPFTPIPPYRISVPTRGVFLEAIQGVCDSCEKVKANSSQDWDKFRVDEPTPISTVVTPTPTITDWKAAFKDFAQPLVNIQNAPETPAPGAGLAGLSELLSKAGVFNDITGLQGNQQNAIRTYLSNQENVKALAEMAKGMAMQQHNTQHSQAITDSITQAREAGVITPEEGSSLVRQHLQQQIDGGESAREQARVERERESPSLSEAVVGAAGQGRSVRAQSIDSDGNQISVDIGEGETQSGINQIIVERSVTPLTQPPGNSCWATAATMLMNWKNGRATTIEEVLREAGNNLTPPDENRYLTILSNNTGLLSSQKAEFINALNMVGEEPASYLPERYIELLENFGPLWITIDSNREEGIFSPHAKILTKISGHNREDFQDMYFTFINPTHGRPETESFNAFINSYEQMARDSGGDSFIQIVRFRDRIPIGEGQDSRTSTRILASSITHLISTDVLYERLSRIAYSDTLNAEELRWLGQSNLEHVRFHSDNEHNLQFHSFRRTAGTDTTPIIAFRGSGFRVEEIWDWLISDFMDMSSPGTASFHHNITQIRDAIRELGGMVDVTGHSLGGCVSQLTGIFNPTQVRRIITFSSPGVNTTAISELIRYSHAHASSRLFESTHYSMPNDILTVAGNYRTPGVRYSIRPLEWRGPYGAHTIEILQSLNHIRLTDPEIFGSMYVYREIINLPRLT